MPNADDIAVLMHTKDADDVRMPGVRIYRRAVESWLEKFPNWFVVTAAVDLPEIASWIKAANRAHKLRGLLIHHADARFAPAMLRRAGLHTLAHTLVHPDRAVFRRVLEAWAVDAQDRLIADATVEDERLFVQTCGLELLEAPLSEFRALRHVEDIENFEIDPDGSFLYWPVADVHLGADAIRAAVDPEFHQRLRAERLAHDRAFGAAVRALRVERELRQSDVTGLSRRQVGRIERGEVHPRLESLRRLAAAHEMEPSDYLDRLAEFARRERNV